MINLKIKLTSVEDAKNFTFVMSNQECEADIISGKYIVDAKSIMGIFSLDLSRPLDLVIHSDSEICGELVEKLEKYIVTT
ncbi:MAG: HPr family phosphocarrier protein [Oscillospiraceae bacterium]|nr:HPr family phosphocarrier protein [Oscillospiraceae bacterium]